MSEAEKKTVKPKTGKAPMAAKPVAQQPVAKKPVGKVSVATVASGKVKVTQVGSKIARRADQEATLIGLGLNKRHRSRVLEDTKAVRGMINKVKHLLVVESAS